MKIRSNNTIRRVHKMTKNINLLNEAFNILAKYNLANMDIELQMRIENHYRSLEVEGYVSN